VSSARHYGDRLLAASHGPADRQVLGRQSAAGRGQVRQRRHRAARDADDACARARAKVRAHAGSDRVELGDLQGRVSVGRRAQRQAGGRERGGADVSTRRRRHQAPRRSQSRLSSAAVARHASLSRLKLLLSVLFLVYCTVKWFYCRRSEVVVAPGVWIVASLTAKRLQTMLLLAVPALLFV
jgi:hypothetical protein